VLEHYQIIWLLLVLIVAFSNHSPDKCNGYPSPLSKFKTVPMTECYWSSCFLKLGLNTWLLIFVINPLIPSPFIMTYAIITFIGYKLKCHLSLFSNKLCWMCFNIIFFISIKRLTSFLFEKQTNWRLIESISIITYTLAHFALTFNKYEEK
jgi:hypothetical protein